MRRVRNKMTINNDKIENVTNCECLGFIVTMGTVEQKSEGDWLWQARG